MAHPSSGEITLLLTELRDGSPIAADKLIPVVYSELRKIARRYLSHERPNHTLEATALVHEAYLRLVDHKLMNWQNRAHFFAISAQIMRQILVDHARAHNAEKRGAHAP